ncbi:hypothetical protein [Terrisporobacter sp.]
MFNKEYICSQTLLFYNILSEDNKNELILKSTIINYQKGEVVRSRDFSCTGLLITI